MITKKYQKTWFNGKIYGIEGDKAIIESIKDSGIWEQAITAVIVNTVKKGDVVLDIGANIGYYSLLLSEMVGEHGKVYSYEAVQDIYQVLKANSDNNKINNIEIYNRAVSNVEGEIQFTYFKNNPGASSQTSIWSDEDKNGFKNRMEIVGGEIEIRAAQSIILDKYLLPELNKLNFVKFDIEGGEGCALEGMKKTLQSFDKVNIISEFLVGNDECDVLSVYNNLAHDYGYSLYKILSTFPSLTSIKSETQDYYCLLPISPESLNRGSYIDALFLSSEEDTAKIGRICDTDNNEWRDKKITYGETPNHTDVYDQMIQAFNSTLINSIDVYDTSDL